MFDYNERPPRFRDINKLFLDNKILELNKFVFVFLQQRAAFKKKTDELPLPLTLLSSPHWSACIWPLQLHIFLFRLLCWLDVLYPLVCRMHAFKGTTEQIRAPSLCTNSLSFISDGDWRASVPWRIMGPSVAPAALRASQCFHCMGAGPWLGPPQVPLPRTLVSGMYSRWKSTQSLSCSPCKLKVVCECAACFGFGILWKDMTITGPEPELLCV